ncbi:hypothetical protein Val02_31730 [Virgisporangium aliadipatigenens]|uniref:Exo-alpha-sialidase n=1 Tax=Virgisporangium aliadipatigenens TaxID=741659 RepID=A0A8J4DRG2_9ACTN|nr:hypothetical protein [Virgisporangium aliadipatigenens]GIJ46287.1 hypothetical protein Val02_31730 [Virgisporangium aliadipatigenens]
MRRILAATVLCLALTACGGTEDAGLRRTGAPPLDAARVTETFGWVLTADALLTTGDGGATFETTTVPLPETPVRAALFTDAEHGTVAAAEDTAIYVARTTDGGKSWQTRELRDEKASPAGYSSLRMASAGDRTVILARVATSQAFRVGTLWTTAGPDDWTALPAPESGRVSVEPDGRIWVAGTALHASTDGGRTWLGSDLKVDNAKSVAVSPPVDGTLPVTVTDGTRSEVQLLTTADDGRTWDTPTRIPLNARTGPGVTVPVARTDTGPMVFDTAGGHAYRGAADVWPRGLPEGVRAATFAGGGRHGWALTARGSCKADKRDCVVTHDLVRTGDAGASWSPIAVWTQPA